MVRSWIVVGGLVVVGLTIALSGCGTESPAPEVSATKATESRSDSPHAHKPSAHGGIIVPIGSDSYHAEAVFEKKGIVRLYTLGADESRILEVAAEPVQAFIKADGDTEAQSIVMRPEPQAGDAAGKTSQFVGQLPREQWGKAINVTIPNFLVGKERFRLSFTNAQEGHGGLTPKGVAAEAEKKLYLEPGGLYTEADIQANGGVVASQRFKSIRAEHDMHPKPGDKICPITETKANPKFSWVVDGKTYEFCCAPCVDEFVARAKEEPKSIKAPEEYVKK
jgi:hypothetical protein